MDEQKKEPLKPTLQPILQEEVATPKSNYPHHSFSRRPSVLYILIALILMGGLGVGLISLNAARDVRSRATDTGPTLTLNPGSKSLAIGNTFALGLTINTNSDTVSAVELHLSYDPTAIQIVSFSTGTPLPVVLVPETHTNGAIAVTLGVQPTSPFKGAGIIGTWTIKILAAKQSSVIFTSATQVAVLGKSTNAITAKTGSTITGTVVSGTPTPTPTLTPTSTPTPTPTPTPTSSPTPTIVPTPTSTPEPTSTPTPTPEPKMTPTPIDNSSLTGTSTPKPPAEQDLAPPDRPTPTPSSSTPQASSENQPSPATKTKTTFGSLSSDTPQSDRAPTNQTANDYSPFPVNTPETGVPKLTIFDQIFADIVQFFRGLFQK